MKVLDIEITMCQMKNTLDKTNSRLDISKNKISRLEDIATETTEMKHTEEKELKKKKTTEHCQDMRPFQVA